MSPNGPLLAAVQPTHVRAPDTRPEQLHAAGTPPVSIIAIVGNTGDGETTPALHLAARLAPWRSVVIVDADTRESAYQWRQVREEHPSRPAVAVAASLAHFACALSHTYAETILADLSAIKARQTECVLRMADQHLIPVQPTPMDLCTATRIV